MEDPKAATWEYPVRERIRDHRERELAGLEAAASVIRRGSPYRLGW